MKFISTRNKNVAVSFSEAIIKGISDDGGLFVPEYFPKISDSELEEMLELDYPARANLILKKFIDEFTLEEINECTVPAYALFDGDPAPVVKIDEDLFFLELYHGPTAAFKDIALTLLPHLISKAKTKLDIKEDILILVATSGDTGKAALEGFKDVEGTKIVVFYPTDGVSNIQKLQMTTTGGQNTYVAAVKGNFDNCQSGVKDIFASEEFKARAKKENCILGSANSINFGRLLPQVVYYFSSYLDMVSSEEIEMGEKINFSVPTGNFGNILAGYYAYKMGLPINKLLCASNQNNILTDFFNNGVYDLHRQFFKTSSPSMDILISSNLERLVFEFSDRNDALTKERLEKLKNDKEYSVTKAELNSYSDLFFADFCKEKETFSTIRNIFDEYDYPIDPHTAVGVFVADGFAATQNDIKKTIILSTASPLKFCEDVCEALDFKVSDDVFKTLNNFASKTAMEIPDAILALKVLKERFSNVYEPSQLEKAILEFLKGIK